jgi:HNH endonuclease
MEPYIAVTNPEWFTMLRQLAGMGGEPDDRGNVSLDEVNFWNPGGRMLKRFSLGTPIFLRLKAPHKCIAGYGYFSVFHAMRLDLAWDCFGPKNGAADPFELARLTGKSPQDVIGCTVLRNVVFWPQERWVDWRENKGWASAGPQRGKTERDPARAAGLQDEIAYDHMATPEEMIKPFQLVDADERQIAQAKVVQRQGQGAFRTQLLQAYGSRCAITGEHTEIVLDAAHIQPYLGPRSNHVQNGLLLTKEFHTLFDAGYVTVTPDYEVRVSSRLLSDWDNGHRYYPVDGQGLVVLPEMEGLRPNLEVLEWHGERRFLDN